MSCIVPLLRLVESAEGHAAHHFLFAHGEHLDVFHEVVAKLVVELAFYLCQFLCCLFGEGTAEVVAHGLSAVVAADKEAGKVGKGVQHGEREKADEPKEAFDKLIFTHV